MFRKAKPCRGVDRLPPIDTASSVPATQEDERPEARPAVLALNWLGVAQHAGLGVAVDVLVQLLVGVEHRDLMIEPQF